MAVIAVTPAQVAPVYPSSHSTLIRAFTALTDIASAGLSLYIDPTTGKVGLCEADVAGKEQFIGISLRGCLAGETLNVLVRGEIYGFTLAGNYASLVFQSDTGGVLADAASATKTVNVGKVVPVNDSTKSKVLFVNADLLRNW